MGQWDVRLISASYRREDDHLVIEMFGKTPDGRSITVRYAGFEPYFHVVEPTEKAIKTLKEDSRVKRVEPVRLFHHGKEHDCIEVVVQFPWLVPDLRDRLKKDFEVLAADIPFHHRFIYDKDIKSCIRVFGEEIEGEYTTDISVNMDSFEDITPFIPDLKILAFDIEASIKEDRVLTICYVVREGDELREGKPLFGEEQELIEQFNDVIREEDPDVITGYNIDNYDIPTLRERAEAVGANALRWGRDLSEPKHVMGRFWRLNGRVVADAWWAAKMELRPKQETLNHVAKLVLDEEKMDVDPKRIDQEWKENKDKVMEYCSKDAELSLRILEEVGTLRKDMDLATVSKLPVDDVHTSGSSQLIDSILIREADRKRVGVPLTSGYSRGKPIEGGYVHTIEPGLYHWVCVLDFKSMYPSLIISKNICFTTLDDDGEIESPVGARFLGRGEKEGLLPTILENLMEERDRVKKERDRADDEEEYRYYDGLQNALKILMNSFYGVFASSFYRFTDKSIGSSITAFARETVKDIIEKLEKEDITVIYSDTDSLFVQSPYDEIEKTIEFGQEIADRFSEEGALLEFEKVFKSLFSHGKKKRYVGKAVWPEEDFLIRGYEVRRTDSFDLQSEVLTTVFERILSDDTEGAVELAREKVRETLEGEVPPERLVISRTCKNFSYYQNPDAQSNVQAARKMMDLGYEFIPGMKVSWIVTNNKKTPQEVEPYISGREFDSEPDYKYYAQRLAQTVARVTEVFGWDEKSLMMGSQQFTLFDDTFNEEAEEKREKKGVKKTEETLTLEDFM